MPTTRDSGDSERFVQMPAHLVERLVAALERIGGPADKADAELQKEFQNLQVKALGELTEKLNQMHYYPPTRPASTDLSLEQKQAALRYDAFRTGLGRPGAAAVVMGERHENVITITAGQLPAVPLTVVAYDSTGNEVGRGALPVEDKGGRRAVISGHAHDISRFEVWDQSGDPIRFGLLITSPLVKR